LRVNRFVSDIGSSFESIRIQALEPQAEAVTFPVQNLHAVARLVEGSEEHRVEHGDLEVQLDQCRQAIKGFSGVDGLEQRQTFRLLRRVAS
jgi:hypothetical protein